MTADRQGKQRMYNAVKILVMFTYLLILSYYDFREKKVPCVLLGAGGMIIILWTGAECLWTEKEWSDVIRGMLPGGALLMVAFLTKKAGCADGIVLLFIGVFEGFKSGILLLCSSLFLLALCSVILLLLRRVAINSRIPYLPFVCITYLLLHLNSWESMWS